ncbi:GntR family transcriptional regulator [uncultured Roseibium sp.]|uniref:GntR family transcriptional regulator n=1 Tax=uncultured Roseibium sp. TaxID=1936171 RepID=UPI003217C855
MTSSDELAARLENANGAQERFEILYGTLRERISMSDYPPGMRLSEEALAAEFGISRSPLRKALKILEADGLLQSVQGVGTIVTDVDLEGLTQVYQLRMELNELVGRLSPKHPDEATLALFEELRKRAEELQAAPDMKVFARLNIDFFHAFMRLTDNQPLVEVSERLFYQTCRIWLKMIPMMDFAEEVAIFAGEINAITDAVRLGDTEAAGHIRRAHLSMGFTRLKSHARQYTL